MMTTSDFDDNDDDDDDDGVVDDDDYGRGGDDDDDNAIEDGSGDDMTMSVLRTSGMNKLCCLRQRRLQISKMYLCSCLAQKF